MSGVIDTDLVNMTGRAAYLAGAMERSPLPYIDVSGSRFGSRDFRLRVEGSLIGDAFFTRLFLNQVELKRLDGDIARHPSGMLLIALLQNGSYDQNFAYHAPFSQTGPGHILMLDLDAPQSVTFARFSVVTCAYVPRRHFEPFIGPEPILKPVMIRPANELHGLLTSCFLSCAALHDPTAITGQAALQTLTRLAMVAYGLDARSCDELRTSLLEARRARAQLFIALRCADPGLNARKVADHLAISLRSLHLAFEPTGISVSAVIMKARLTQAMQSLRHFPQRSVLDVALDSGFNNLATFYRAFGRQFGNPPGTHRVPPPKNRCD
ncbi:helix-turn-helix transcriptional regulator [Rhizobium sp.]